jgi:hypothetical protein
VKGRIHADGERGGQIGCPLRRLTATLTNLIALAEAGAGDVPELASRLKARKADRETINRQLSGLSESTNRESLKAALEQRIADWRSKLRSEHPEEARYVVRQLIGPLKLWKGSNPQEDRKFFEACGLDANSEDGKEGIEFAACGFAATITPAGLLNGIGALSVVAGARNKLYRRLCWAAA